MLQEMPVMSSGGGGGGSLFETSTTCSAAMSGINTGIKVQDASGCYGLLGQNSYGMYGAYAKIENGVITTPYGSLATITTNASDEIIITWTNSGGTWQSLEFNICVW